MVEVIFFIWLLVAAAIFVSVALTSKESEPSAAIWLLVLAASWPLVLLLMAVGGVLVTLSSASSTKR